MPRRPTDADAVRDLANRLGSVIREPTTLYLVGGATAVIVGWRETTIDVDMFIEPERDDVLRAIPGLKEELGLNIELASPLDFLPELPGWRDRSQFVSQHGPLTLRHFDFYGQALAKLERDFVKDREDVEAMVSRALVEPRRLEELFEAIEEQLYRFPTVDPRSLRLAVQELAGERRGG